MNEMKVLKTNVCSDADRVGQRFTMVVIIGMLALSSLCIFTHTSTTFNTSSLQIWLLKLLTTQERPTQPCGVRVYFTTMLPFSCATAVPTLNLSSRTVGNTNGVDKEICEGCYDCHELCHYFSNCDIPTNVASMTS